MNRPLPKMFQIVGTITTWRADWQRSLRSGRSIVVGLGVDTGDHQHSAIENSQIGSQYMKDNGTISSIDHPDLALDVVIFSRLTLLPSMLLFRINEGVENAENRLYK